MEDRFARLKAELTEILERFSRNPAAEDGDRSLDYARDDTGDGMTAEREAKILEGAVRRYGKDRQVVKAIEEMGELIQALCKWLGGSFGYIPELDDNVTDNMDDAEFNALCDKVNAEIDDHILEELADVIIVTKQLEMIFGDPTEWEIRKLERLERMVQE